MVWLKEQSPHKYLNHQLLHGWGTKKQRQHDGNTSRQIELEVSKRCDQLLNVPHTGTGTAQELGHLNLAFEDAF